MSVPDIIAYRQLVALREPAIKLPTPAWEATLRLFYGLELAEDLHPIACQITERNAADLASLQGHRYREAWASVGRRGEKSWEAAGIASYEHQHGGHERYLVPGERGYVVVVSKDLAGTHIVTSAIRAHFDALGVRYNETRQGNMRVLEVEGSAMAIACCPANGVAVRGYPIAVAICDEIAFWPSSSEMAHPDVEILAALRPAGLQFPNRKLIAISSANAKFGAHYDTIHGETGTGGALGNADEIDILAVKGPTWVFNPSVSEADTRRLERDRKRWAREYKSEPQDSTSAALDGEQIEAAVRQPPESTWLRCIGYIDAAAGKSAGADQFAWCLAGYVDPIPYAEKRQWTGERWEDVLDADGRPVPADTAPQRTLVIWSIDAAKGAYAGQLASGELWDRIAQHFRRANVECVFGDQFGSLSSHVELSKRYLDFREIPWTNQRKSDAIARLRQLLSDGAIILPNDPELIREAKAYTERVTTAGSITYGARGAGKDDRIACVLGVVMAELEHGIPGSPVRFRGRTEVEGA